jgi:hypothetical protein
MKDVANSWNKFLHPETLRGNLLVISLYIAAYELFKTSIIEKPETFYSTGFNKDGIIISDKYKIEVLALSKSRLYASLLWLKEMGAIDNSDIETFDGIRKHRNEVTHELVDFLANNNRNFDYSKFQALIELLGRIERWWFINFEVAIDPEILPDGADSEEVISGRMVSIKLMLDIALGAEPEEGYYYKALKNKV